MYFFFTDNSTLLTKKSTHSTNKGLIVTPPEEVSNASDHYVNGVDCFVVRSNSNAKCVHL